MAAKFSLATQADIDAEVQCRSTRSDGIFTCAQKLTKRHVL